MLQILLVYLLPIEISGLPALNFYRAGMLHNISHCLAWKIPSKDRFNRDRRVGSLSHLRMEKSDSTEVVLAKVVAKPARNCRSAGLFFRN